MLHHAWACCLMIKDVSFTNFASNHRYIKSLKQLLEQKSCIANLFLGEKVSKYALVEQIYTVLSKYISKIYNAGFLLLRTWEQVFALADFGKTACLLDSLTAHFSFCCMSRPKQVLILFLQLHLKTTLINSFNLNIWCMCYISYCCLFVCIYIRHYLYFLF